MESDDQVRRPESGSIRIGPDDALAALETVTAMKRAALVRGLPPRWLGASIAGIFGLAIALQAAGASQTVALIAFLGVVPVFWLNRKTLTAMARRSGYGFSWRLLAAQAVLVVIVVGLPVVGKWGRLVHGWVWAPWASGLAVAAAIYAVFEFKRATFAASIAASEGV